MYQMGCMACYCIYYTHYHTAYRTSNKAINMKYKLQKNSLHVRIIHRVQILAVTRYSSEFYKVKF